MSTLEELAGAIGSARREYGLSPKELKGPNSAMVGLTDPVSDIRSAVGFELYGGLCQNALSPQHIEKFKQLADRFGGVFSKVDRPEYSFTVAPAGVYSCLILSFEKTKDTRPKPRVEAFVTAGFPEYFLKEVLKLLSFSALELLAGEYTFPDLPTETYDEAEEVFEADEDSD